MRSLGRFILAAIVGLGVSIEASAQSSAQSPRVFSLDDAPQLGVSFTHETGARGTFFMPEIFGSGAALFDLDGDGDLDVLAVDGGLHGRTTSGSAIEAAEAISPRHRLWRQGADGRFSEVESPGLVGGGYGMGVAVGDIDGDGLDDLFIAAYGRDALYRNRGDGRFVDITEIAGLDDRKTNEAREWSTSALFFDFDDDRDLDLFVVRYLRYEPQLACSDQAGRPDYCGPGAFAPIPDRLWRNDGHGRFTDVTETTGLAAPGKGLGAVAADFDRDGRLDLYVANDGEPNRLWLQEKAGRFVDRAVEKGAAVDALGRPEAGMGVALGDADGDGLQDLLLSHLRTETNTLYLADAELGFLDQTLASGVGGPSLPMTGFGTVFLDLDLDGDLDLLVTNGAVTRNPRPAQAGVDDSARDGAAPAQLARDGFVRDGFIRDGFIRDYGQNGLAFENLGDGRFRKVDAGAFTDTPSVGRALVRGDIDGDGDDDLVQSSSGGPLRILLNGQESGHHWTRIRLNGTRAGAGAEHATVRVTAGGSTQTHLFARGQGYLSSQAPEINVGLGRAERIDHLEVRFRDGYVARFGQVPTNRRLLLGHPAQGDSAELNGEAP